MQILVREEDQGPGHLASSYCFYARLGIILRKANLRWMEVLHLHERTEGERGALGVWSALPFPTIAEGCPFLGGLRRRPR